MSWWPIVVYGIAALLAVRLLFALMIQHRHRHLQQLIDVETERRQAEADAAAATEAEASEAEKAVRSTPARRNAAA